MFLLLGGTDCPQLCMTGQLGNWLWSACSKTESDFCPSKGRFFIAFPKYLAHKNNCTCIGRVMSCPVVLIKDGLLQLHKSCSILCSHWNFFLQYVFDGECPWSRCRKGMEMSLPAYRSKWVVWECDPEKLLHSSLQWFSWRQFGCRGISMQHLFDKNWRKSVCSFYRSIILKHSCISGVLKWKSVAHSPN